MRLILPLSVACYLLCIVCQAQKINSKVSQRGSDTLFIFNPIGEIRKIEGFGNTSDPELTIQFEEILIKYLQLFAPCKTVFLQDTIPGNTEGTIIGTIDRISKLSDSLFTNLNCGTNINSLINSYPGRFFAILCYKGIYNDQFTQQLVVGSLMGAAVGSSAMLMPMTKEPHFKSYFLIVDKKLDRYLYFNSVNTIHSPAKENYIEKHAGKLWKDYIK